MAAPDLSVVIASYRSDATIIQTLEALEPQLAAHAVEVTVVDSSADGTAARVAERFPWARVEAHPTRLYPGDARNLGIEASSAPVIGFVDADTIPAPDWVAALIAARNGGADDTAPIVGGSVDNATPDSRVAWANHFCEFGAWLPRDDTRRRRQRDLPTCCLSITRQAFERYGPFVEGTYCSDTVLNQRAGREGRGPVFDPSIRVSHVGIRGFAAFTRKRFVHGRAYARIRVAEERFSRGRRIAYVAASPLIALVLFARCAKSVRAAPRYRRPFAAASPLVLHGMVTWALGEAVGYAEGAR